MENVDITYIIHPKKMDAALMVYPDTLDDLPKYHMKWNNWISIKSSWMEKPNWFRKFFMWVFLGVTFKEIKYNLVKDSINESQAEED